LGRNRGREDRSGFGKKSMKPDPIQWMCGGWGGWVVTIWGGSDAEGDAWRKGEMREKDPLADTRAF